MRVRNSLHWVTLFAISVTLFFTGCASKTGTATPSTPKALCAGGANSFDCTAFDILVTVKAAIDQAKVGIPDSKKALLNKIIDAYNDAQVSYKAYHVLAATGGGDQPALQAKLTSLQSQVAQLGAK